LVKEIASQKQFTIPLVAQVEPAWIRTNSNAITTFASNQGIHG
jgi:hypothetical protein